MRLCYRNLKSCISGFREKFLHENIKIKIPRFWVGIRSRGCFSAFKNNFSDVALYSDQPQNHFYFLILEKNGMHGGKISENQRYLQCEWSDLDNSCTIRKRILRRISDVTRIAARSVSTAGKFWFVTFFARFLIFEVVSQVAGSQSLPVPPRFAKQFLLFETKQNFKKTRVIWAARTQKASFESTSNEALS